MTASEGLRKKFSSSDYENSNVAQMEWTEITSSRTLYDNVCNFEILRPDKVMQINFHSLRR
jgi:hypothetical protein